MESIQEVNMKDKDPWNFDKFVVGALALITIVMTLIAGSCCMHIDYRISQAIEAGVDPVLARAAFSSSDGSYERVIHVSKEK